MDGRRSPTMTPGNRPPVGTGLGQAVTYVATRDPSGLAVACFGSDGEVGRRTREELDRRTNQLARLFELLGVEFGDLVTIALPNSIEFLEVALAAWKLGATPQPVSARMPEVERQAIIDLARPALVVGGAPDGVRAHLPEGFELDPELDDGPLPDLVAPHRLAVASGGSTGRPKLIVANRRAEVFDGDLVGMGSGGVVVIPGPLYHNGPLSNALDALCTGNSLVIFPRFDPEATLAAIERYQATWAFLVPTMMLRIWRLPESVRSAYDVSSLTTLWHMGAPCPEWLKEAWIAWIGATRVFEMYTCTEALAGAAIRGDEWLTHRGSVGRVVFGEMKVVDPESGTALPPDEVGEIYLRSDGIGTPTYQYVGAETRSLPGGWHSVGDMGRFDQDGYLYLADRRVDMILVGGANVYPAEVEAAILAHSGVASCAVVGLPDEEMGNRVHAIVQPSAIGVTEEDLKTFLTDRLVRYKIPRSFEFVEETLRDDAGKVRRSALRSERADVTVGRGRSGGTVT